MALAVVVLLLALVSPAAAETEVTVWHAMGGALGEKVKEITDAFNKTQSEYKVTPVYKGNYTETMTAAIAAFRAPAAARGPGVRGGDGHHDVRARRHQAGARADGRGGRALRSLRLLARRDRLLHVRRRQDALAAVQQLDAGALLQQGRVQEGRPRSRQGAGHVARAGRRRQEAPGGRSSVRLHHRLAVVDPAREPLRLAQRAVRDQGQRLRRPRHRAALQHAIPRQARHAARGVAEDEALRLR